MTAQRNVILAFVGAVIAAVGVFLPWLSLTSGLVDASRTGIEMSSDALIILAIAVVAALAAFLVPRVVPRSSLAAGLAIVVIGILDWNELKGRNSADALVSVGPGIYACLLGAVLLVVASFVRPAAAPPAP
jgi:drug/metabolite transporter (DMT)-like permease